MTVKARVEDHTDGATVPGVDLGRLSGWMDATGLGSGAITDTRLLTGGTQNILLRYRRGDREYLLRRPALHKRANSDETMRREARVLAALAGSGVPDPGLIASCEDIEVIGAGFYLMEPVEGIAALDWELCTLGDPLLDLGHLLATWPTQGPGALTELPDAPGLPSRSEMTEHYAQTSGRTVDAITWYQVLACYRLALLLEGGHARARSGQTPDNVGETCRRGAAALLHQARDLIAHRTEGRPWRRWTSN